MALRKFNKMTSKSIFIANNRELLKIKLTLKCNGWCGCNVTSSYLSTCRGRSNGSFAVDFHVSAAPELTSGTPLQGIANLALIITWLLSTHMSSQSAVGIVSVVCLSIESVTPWTEWQKPQLDRKSSYAVLQTTFSYSFSTIKIVVFSFNIPLVYLTSISSRNDLALNRRQAIIWTIYGQVYWRRYASLGHSELNSACVLVTFCEQGVHFNNVIFAEITIRSKFVLQ